MKSNLWKISLTFVLIKQSRVTVFAEEASSSSGRGRFVLSLAIAYILMIVCLIIFSKAKKYAEKEKAKQQEQEKELKPWQKENKYMNFPFNIFDKKRR